MTSISSQPPADGPAVRRAIAEANRTRPAEPANVRRRPIQQPPMRPVHEKAREFQRERGLLRDDETA